MRLSSEQSKSVRGVHRFAAILAGLVILLISAGAFVTSKEAGLAVPDWPLSYGSMNPPDWWTISNVRAEHGHRLIAGTVALLTVGLMLWIRRRESRRWVRRIAYLAVLAVLVQAGLGGITVLFFLPTAISVAHAALAEIFLCLVVTLAVVTSRSWTQGRQWVNQGEVGWRLRVPLLTTGLIFVQILIGAVMRHSGAGLAIPDFPLSFGRVIPPVFDFPIAIHFAHRVGAIVVTAAVVATVVLVSKYSRDSSVAMVPAVVMSCLVVLQVSLGAAVVLTGKSVFVNTAHVATGATLLAASLILSLNIRRALSEPRLDAVGSMNAAGSDAIDSIGDFSGAHS